MLDLSNVKHHVKEKCPEFGDLRIGEFFVIQEDYLENGLDFKINPLFVKVSYETAISTEEVLNSANYVRSFDQDHKVFRLVLEVSKIYIKQGE